MSALKPGDRVRYSAYALRSDRDYWLGLGQYAAKARAKEQLDAKAARRGTVTAIVPGRFVSTVVVKFDGQEGEHRADPYLFEIA